MRIAIIGLPASGKTTVFNAATRGSAQVAAYSAASAPNIGVAKVPDARLATLASIYRPQKTTPAEITYLDLPAAPDGLGRNRGISGVYLNRLQSADAIAIVARAFEDPSVPDGGDGVDAFRDIETMMYEMTFADLEIVERRLERIAQNEKGARAAERDYLRWERDLMLSLKDGLEDGEHIRSRSLAPSQRTRINEFQFLTAKPLIVIVNAGEETLGDIDAIQARLDAQDLGDGVAASALVGSLEMELAQMSAEDEAEFRESLGAGESGLDRMVRLSYSALDRITFFTGGPKEARAWTTARGDAAPRAAGRIHSDMERGFIRAEVVSYEDLARYGSEAESRRHGALRLEGKSYIVRDGDVMHVLFNV